MNANSERMRDLYRRRARQYDFAVSTYRLLGLRERRYRRHAVEALTLTPGDTVVDLACGTGLNFELLQAAVGPEGTIVGVDLTDAMLDVARKRAATAGWANVQLVEADVADYEFPHEVCGILSTFGLCLVPDFDAVVRSGAAALRPGYRMAIFDLKRPESWPEWMARATAWINRPFGVTVEGTQRRPWESVKRYLDEVCFREYYFGYLYLSVGQVPGEKESEAPARTIG